MSAWARTCAHHWLPDLAAGELAATKLDCRGLGRSTPGQSSYRRFDLLSSVAAAGVALTRPAVGIVVTLILAFMCMGSCWYPLADQSRLLRWNHVRGRKNAPGRSLGRTSFVSCTGWVITPFHLYLAALLLVAYASVRLFAQSPQKAKTFLHVFIPLGIVLLLGTALGAIVTLPYVDAVLNSPRGSGTTSLVAGLSSKPIFGLESPLHYFTALLRPFANDILGVAAEFRGSQNYLEAPIPYCGLLCLVVLPQVFVGASRRHTIMIALLFAALLIPILFPWFRYLFWLFQGDYYRTYSLFSIFAVIILAMIVFSRYSEGKRLNLILLAITTLCLIAILYLPFYQNLVNPSLKVWATILLLAYPVLLTTGQIMNRQNMAALVLVGLTTIELITFDRITVLDRKIVTKDELTQRSGYNDETIEAVRDVYSADQAFFRMTKLRPSTPSDFPSLNDAMVFGYYGTTSYSSFNSVNYTNFLTVSGAIGSGSETQTRWATGLADSALLSAFACEKYVLVDDPTRFPTDPYYERIRPYGRERSIAIDSFFHSD